MAKQAGNQIACSSSAKWSGRTLNVAIFVAMHARISAAIPQVHKCGAKAASIYSNTQGVGWGRNESPHGIQVIKLH